MKNTHKRLLFFVIWFLSTITAFVGGVYFRIAYYVSPSALQPVGHIMQDYGPRPRVESFATANKDVEAFISNLDIRKSTFYPRVIVAPSHIGYTIYVSSGSATRVFPDELLQASIKVIRESFDKSVGEEEIAPNDL